GNGKCAIAYLDDTARALIEDTRLHVDVEITRLGHGPWTGPGRCGQPGHRPQCAVCWESADLLGGSTRALTGRSYAAVALVLAPFQPWQPVSWHGAPRWR